MAFDINQFRAALQYDGARPNLYDIVLNLPGIAQSPNGGSDVVTISRKLTFMAKASQLPGSTIGLIPQHYFGREVKIPGNRTYPEWTVTIINDEDFSIRNSFESWLDSISGNVSNIRAANAVNYNGYSTQAQIRQYGKDGSIIKTYEMYGMFPTDVTPIDVGWNDNDVIEEFSVTLAFQYWTSVNSTNLI